jgi:eukaryotic-like serine/threonine-protein kinase
MKPSLLSELKRRKVFRAAAVYAATAFVVAQAADIFLPGLGLPDWSLRLVLVLLVLGFPAAVLAAWTFDITLDGIRRTGAAPARPDSAWGEPALPARRGKPGRRVAGGRYELIEKVGAGAMGVVYRARDTRLEREVALKFLPDSLREEEGAAARFLQEARAAAALNHPNITTLHAIELDEDRPFLVMELVEGETLAQQIARAGPLPIDAVVRIAYQVAVGLAEAHAKGIVHRDIKPANLMVMADGRVKIMDFGIAKVRGGPAMTRVGSTLGSAAYMSPEQVRGEGVDGRSDLWALGAVLYEALTQRLPFPGDNDHTVLRHVLHVEAEPIDRVRPDVPNWLSALVMRMLTKDRAGRPGSAIELLSTLPGSASSPAVPVATLSSPALVGRKGSGWRVAMVGGLAAVLVASAAWLHQRGSTLDRARHIEVPALLALVDDHDCLNAVMRIRELERILGSDRQLAEARQRCAAPSDVVTDPPGAEAYLRAYGDRNGEWYHLGTTPLSEVELPFGFFIWRIERPGYEPLEHALTSWGSRRFAFSLSLVDEVPAGMVRVPGGPTSLGGEEVELEPYWIDRHEVTNAEYQKFVDVGGYHDPTWWRQPFVHNGRRLEWSEAMALLRDATGQPGPATWELSSHPEAEPNHPVGGVSWHEAAAYCAWAGKELPTVFHWSRAAGGDGSAVARLFSDILWLSNFDAGGPVPVGSRGGISRYGVHDMAGNVKEWAWNSTGDRHYILGGAWNEPPYLFTNRDARTPFERGPTHGFRCARYDQTPSAEASASLDVSPSVAPDPQPISDEAYRLLIRPYSYDDSPLNARLEGVDDSSPHWRRETVSFDAAYGGERVLVHLYFPRNASPPYQSVLYFPSGSALAIRTSGGADVNYVLFVARSGRVLVHPVLKGTYERWTEVAGPAGTRDATIQRAKDVRRTVDYLLTRPDLDAEGIAYLGQSWGATMGPIMTALEDRFAASVLISGGLSSNPAMPEISQPNFAPRVQAPTLMVNGRQDFLATYEERQLPLFRLLGSSHLDKELRVFDGGHVPDLRDVIRETNEWLDRYMGPVRR